MKTFSYFWKGRRRWVERKRERECKKGEREGQEKGGMVGGGDER